MTIELQENSTTRIEAFSDGILAIVITLMVLEIKLPQLSEHITNEEAVQALLPLIPKLSAYALSFLMLAIFWVNHHQLFTTIRTSTRSLLWLNNLWLFWICLLPFPTAFLGEHPSLTIASIFFGSELFLCALSFFLIRYYCYRQNLFHAHLAATQVKQQVKKSFIAPVFYLTSVLLSVFSVYLAYTIFIMVPIIFIVSSIKSVRK